MRVLFSPRRNVYHIRAEFDRFVLYTRGRHVYLVSRQWTIWRILSHDLHHGGQLAILLGLQGIDIPDLGERGGHLTELPWPSQPRKTYIIVRPMGGESAQADLLATGTEHVGGARRRL